MPNATLDPHLHTDEPALRLKLDAAPLPATPLPVATTPPQFVPRADLGSAFRGTIVPRKPTAAYKGALLAVAVLMVLLPCLYAALTGLLGWWVHHYATQTLPRLLHGSLGLWLMAAFTAPAVAGAVMVLFMLKPLVVPRGRRMHPIKLLPQAEPGLQAFTERLCALLGAPRPRRIEVDCNVNAAASLRGGLRGFLRGEMTLTIGLPLVAGLSLEEFTGVLAHEFGHFTQGSAMRVTYLIRSVNAWFSRVVYERDRLDEWLVGTMFTGFGALTFVGVIANLGVWLSRLVLKTLMYLGHALSSVLLRQMEYDADRCEARVVGSDTCAATTRRIGVLARTAADLEHDVVGQWQGTLRLPDDFPALLAQRLEHLSAEKVERCESELLALKASWADSHPSPAQRIAAVRAAAEPGVFAAAGPATQLFEHFEPLSRAVSRAHYEDDLDLIVNADLLTPVERLLAGAR